MLADSEIEESDIKDIGEEVRCARIELPEPYDWEERNLENDKDIVSEHDVLVLRFQKIVYQFVRLEI
jgi:uncharacterized membrane protein